MLDETLALSFPVFESSLLGGEARFRGRASANFRSEVGPPSSCQECEHAPQLCLKSQAPKREKSSAESLPKRSDPFGLLHCLLYIVFEGRASSSLVIGEMILFEVRKQNGKENNLSGDKRKVPVSECDDCKSCRSKSSGQSL